MGEQINKPLSSADLAELARYDTPTICNAIELFGIQPQNTGYADGRLHCCFPKLPPMVGYAATAMFRSASPSASGSGYSSVDDQLAQFEGLPGPPVVVFQDMDEPSVGATFGEMMCSTYKAFGGAGLVTSGAGRDLDQVEAIRFPVFTCSTICSHGYCAILHLNEPVRVAGLTIHPGDLLHGDRNGLTKIPHAISRQVIEASAGIVHAEAPILDYTKSAGRVTRQELAKAQVETTARLTALRKKFRAK